MNWAGLPNIFWWADRESGTWGIYGSQVIPTADPKSIQLFEELEKAMYEKIRESRGEK